MDAEMTTEPVKERCYSCNRDLEPGEPRQPSMVQHGIVYCESCSAPILPDWDERMEKRRARTD